MFSFAFSVLTSAQIPALQKQREKTKGRYLSLGYHQSDFLSSAYRTSIRDKVLTRNLGYYAGLSYQYNPLIFDVSYFSSGFKTDNLPDGSYGANTLVRHQGGEVSISINLLPDIPVFHPCVGIGYQLSHLTTPKKSEENKNIEKVSSLDTSSPIWLAGFNLQFSPGWAISVRFKSSLVTNRENYQLAAGFLYRPRI